MTTLTERYVHEVVRRIPADQRDDVADELRATIADTVDARETDDHHAAEREVLTEMGDPIRLAHRYADRPLALIGPQLYPAYIRLLTMLLTIVLPIVVAVATAVEAIDTADIGKAIATAVVAILTVGAQLIAWSTVVFAVLERIQHRADVAMPTKPWTVDDLPRSRRPSDGRGLGDAIPAIVWHVFLIGALLWNFSYVPGGGDRVHVLDQSLWSLWIWPILAGLAGIVLVEIARIAKGHWSLALAGCHAVVQALFAVPLLWVLSQREFLSDEFITAIRSQSSEHAFHVALAVGVLLVTVYEIIKRFREAREVIAD